MFLDSLGRTRLVLVATLIPAVALSKTAAATDLMQKLIPDVEEWLRQSQALHKE